MKKLLLVITLSIGMLYAAGFQSGKGQRGQAQGQNQMQQGKGQGQSSTVTELTEVQAAELLYIFQEEKLARDVYTTLYALFPQLKVFKGIIKQEQVHMNAVGKLCTTYDIDISDVNQEAIGEFTLPELQDMYNTFVVRGSESPLDALYIGELIELIDIDDLENASDGMPRDVQRTFFRLLKGSNKHLDKFRASIEKLEA